MADDAWVMNLITMASSNGRARDAAIRALWIRYGWLVEEIHEVCSVDLEVIRWALNHHPVIQEDQ
jgi:ribosomal protein S11